MAEVWEVPLTQRCPLLKTQYLHQLAFNKTLLSTVKKRKKFCGSKASVIGDLTLNDLSTHHPPARTRPIPLFYVEMVVHTSRSLTSTKGKEKERGGMPVMYVSRIISVAAVENGLGPA